MENGEDPLPKTSNGNSKKSELVVYLYNVVEDEWSFIDALSDNKKKQEEIDNSETTADCFFFAQATEPNFIYVSPKKISREYQQYVRFITGYKFGEVLVPKIRTHLLSLDLINDHRLFNYLVEKSQEYKKLTLLSYSASPEFYQLIDKLRNAGVNIYAPEAPDIDSAWSVNFYGSKSGIRQLAQKSVAAEPDFMMAEGVICVGIFDAAKIAANKYLKQKGVVLKTNKGCSGNGLLIFRENDLPNNYLECEKTIAEYLSREPYWQKFPIVVEDLINVNKAIGGGYPNIEFKIHKNGRIEMLYYGAMVVTDKGKFLGMDIADDTLGDRVTARIIDTGYYVAEQYSTAGYRGHFDIDMIAAKNNHVYVTESNTRNTGATDAFKITLKLFGKDFLDDVYVISRSHYHFKSRHAPKLNQVLNALGPLLYSHQTKEGVIINSELVLKRKEFIYMIMGKNKKRAYELDEQMTYLLNTIK